MAQAAPAGNIQAQIQGEVSGQIAVGNYNLQIGSVHGGVVNVYPPGQAPQPTARPTPITIQPRAFPDLLGREAAAAAAGAALQAATPVQVYNPPGWGKTSLLRYLAYQPAATARRDGVAYLSAARQPLADVQQCLFDTFYQCPVPFKPDDAQLRLALHPIQATLLLDDVDLSRDDLETLLNLAPQCAFLIAAPQRTLWGEGQALPVRGLPAEAALALLTRELGRPLAAAEQPAAQALLAATGSQPLALIQAAGLVRDTGQSLAQVAQQMQPAAPDAPGAAAPPTVAGLSAVEQQILAVLATAQGAGVGQEHLPPLTGQPDVSAALQTLLQRGLVQAHSPRYSLTGDLPARLAAAWDLTAWEDRALAYFAAWAERHRQEPGTILAEADAIQQILRRAVARPDRQAQVIRLGWAVEGALALGGLWAAWGQVLGWVQQAATAGADQGATAWALHQIGTRTMCLGDKAAAHASLSQALQMREALGDQVGAAVTRHNLSLFAPRAPAPARYPAPAPDPTAAVLHRPARPPAALPGAPGGADRRGDRGRPAQCGAQGHTANRQRRELRRHPRPALPAGQSPRPGRARPAYDLCRANRGPWQSPPSWPMACTLTNAGRQFTLTVANHPALRAARQCEPPHPERRRHLGRRWAPRSPAARLHSPRHEPPGPPQGSLAP